MGRSIYYEKLNFRDLWIDGKSSININGLYDKILTGDLNFFGSDVVSENAKQEIIRFASLSNIEMPKVTVKSSPTNNSLNTSFAIPKSYMDADIQKIIMQSFKKRHNISNMSNKEKEKRLYRIADEIEKYNELGMYDVLRCMIYIIDTFKENNVIWGPGRGSACCSYILYLLEVHDIDSFYFELDIKEFLR